MKTAEEFFVKHWANWTDDDSGSYETTKTACVKLMQEYSNQQLAEYKKKLKEVVTENKLDNGAYEQAYVNVTLNKIIELIDKL